MCMHFQSYKRQMVRTRTSRSLTSAYQCVSRLLWRWHSLFTFIEKSKHTKHLFFFLFASLNTVQQLLILLTTLLLLRWHSCSSSKLSMSVFLMIVLKILLMLTTRLGQLRRWHSLNIYLFLKNSNVHRQWIMSCWPGCGMNIVESSSDNIQFFNNFTHSLF